MQDYQDWVNLAKQQNDGNGHDSTFPIFFSKEVEDKGRTKVEGRPIFKMVDYVEIIIPGDKNNRPKKPVSDEHKKRWPMQWQAYQSNQQEVIDGTPINQWAYLTPARVAELRAIGCRTIESVANFDETHIKRLGPDGFDLKRRAQQALKPQSDVEQELRSEVSVLESENKELKMTMEHLQQRLEALEAAANSKKSPAELGQDAFEEEEYYEDPPAAQKPAPRKRKTAKRK